MKQLISKTAIKKPDGTRAVQRALTILGLFTEERCNWSLSELSRASGFDKATTLRLIRTLEAEAVLVPAGESGQYSMGPKVLRWAQAVGSATELKSAAVPLIDALWAETNETVTLAVLAGNFRVAILERQSPQPIRRVVEMYVPLPLHCGAAGKAILATFGADDLTAYFLRTRLIAYTTSTVVGQDELRYELRRVRRRGYATALQERIPDGAGIAAAVCGPSGKAVGAIAVSFPSHRFDRKSIARWSRGLTRAAAELTQFVS